MAKFYKYSQWTRIKNKATLGLLVAVTAQKKDMRLKFFAADGVHLMNCKEIGKIVGEGTGM